MWNCVAGWRRAGVEGGVDFFLPFLSFLVVFICLLGLEIKSYTFAGLGCNDPSVAYPCGRSKGLTFVCPYGDSCNDQ